jgi:MerR family redox-sensitive transcriptional activator SoxR
MSLTLDEVGVELSKLPVNRAPESADWAKIAGSWSKRIDERIAELERLRTGLTQCIGCGCLSLKQCQMANPGDRASRFGPGPRYWLGDKRQ